MNSESGGEQRNSSPDTLKQRQKVSQTFPTFTGQQANILYTMPIQTVERLEQVLRSTLALQRNGFSGHQKEPGASGHSGPAGPLAEPDGGASSEYVRGLEESPAWDPGGEPTGWEAERRIYEAALRTGPGVPGRWLEADEYLPEMGSPHDSEFHGGGRGDQHPDLQAADVTEDVLRLLARLEQQADSDVMDATTRHSHGNRKALTKEQAKKIAMGHKADDHEEGQKNELSDFPQHSGNLKCWGESLAGRFKK